MIFLRPEYLVFMLIPLIILFYFIVTGKSLVQTVFDEKMLEKLTVDTDSLGRTGRNLMLFVALFLMIIALARPAIPRGSIDVASQSIDLLVGLDISKSMLATDRYPNRLQFAKKKLYELLEKFDEARVGVIAFADDGFIVSPLTEDRSTLRFLIENLNTDALSTNGTNLLVPILKAKEFLKEDREKILILFTDGGDKSDFTKEIEEARKAGVTIYIYAVGTRKGAPIPYHGQNLKDERGDIVISRLNDAVKRVAIETGGAYIEGGYKDESIDLIIKDIKAKFKMKQLKSRKVQEFEELFYFPLTMAIFFMLFAFSSLPKSSRTAFLLPLLFTLPQPSHAGFLDFHEIRQGFEMYHSGRYRDAVKHFQSVAESRKDGPSYYDLGNAYYRSGRYKEAIRTYKKAHTNDPKLRYKLFFNMGNAYYRLKAYKKALDAYEYAKKFHVEPDLLYNIELAKKHLKKEPPKSKPSTQQKKQQQKKRQKERQQNQKNQKSPQKAKQNSASDKAKQNEARQKGGQSQSRQQAPISPQEMKKWERKLQQSRPKTMPLRYRLDDAKREKNAKPW